MSICPSSVRLLLLTVRIHRGNEQGPEWREPVILVDFDGCHEGWGDHHCDQCGYDAQCLDFDSEYEVGGCDVDDRAHYDMGEASY